MHDIAYEEQRVLVELDGRLGHDGEDRVRDGIRDRRSATRAWLTVRAFWNDVAGAPCTLATEVGEVLNQRGWRTGPTRVDAVAVSCSAERERFSTPQGR